ncbi:MAG: M28 family peptidase [Alphaproteobacteria bacterium]|nr:M28 family peptidase [Alphaproteobacteria bacterium]
MILLLGLLACKDASVDSAAPEPPLPDAVLDALSMTRIRDEVDLLAGDAFQGRTPGSEGHRLAREHLAEQMGSIGLTPLGEAFEVPFDLALDDGRYTFDETGAVVPVETDTGWNLAGVLPGTARPDEYIVLMAHYDHLGVDRDGEVYNGALDDITAVASLLELARVFVDEGVTLERSVLFLITDAEEGGLNGSEAWTVDPGVTLDDVVLGLSLDPFGRPILPDYGPLVLLGGERCPALRDRFRALSAFSDADVAFVNRSPIVIFGSDQDSLWALDEPVPSLWVTAPGMAFYHTVEDTADTIDYRVVRDHLRFTALAVKSFGDDTERFEDVGPQTLSEVDAADAAALMEGVLGSTHLTAGERNQAEDFRDTFAEAAAEGVDDDTPAAYLQAAFFLMFELTRAHPGEIPPPFPE